MMSGAVKGGFLGFSIGVPLAVGGVMLLGAPVIVPAAIGVAGGAAIMATGMALYAPAWQDKLQLKLDEVSLAVENAGLALSQGDAEAAEAYLGQASADIRKIQASVTEA
ncbi:hypothetical protein IID21_04770, partial [Patescibacteria group bacterium]|nr:hypothetical protein [Patescibacteria group bacterium]